MTELTWEGKCKDGKKVSPVRIALPFQTIETVNESAQQRQKTLDFFAAEPAAQYGKEWRNRLIWGDKKYVLPSLLPEFAGKINLIYIDPPFDTGADFSFTATIPDNPETEEDETVSFVKEPSIIEQKAYRDTWGKGLDSYLQWFYETAILLRELLSDNGSIYVHLDWHVCHYVKAVMDEVFGYENFKNEIVWRRTFNVGSSKAISRKFPINTDSIFWYSKSNLYNFNKIYTELSPGALKRYDKVDEQGRRFKWNPMKTYSKAKLDKLISAGEAMVIPTSKYPVYKHYLDSDKGKVIENLWDDIAVMGTFGEERLDYATQKPEALLDRIIKASSNEGDLVLDCFCGSGTTAAVAEKLNRRWITCDLGRFAIHTTRKRLLKIDNMKPFIVQNLGKYERQQWMLAEFESRPGGPENRLQQEKAYRRFILELYHGNALDGYTWLHGSKAGRMVHVGSVEAPVTVEDIKSAIIEFWKLVGKDRNVQTNGLDFLGWDFAFDVNEIAKQFASENKVNVAFKKIPREVLEKRAVEQGDIRFYELAALSAKVDRSGMKIKVMLENFIIPQDDVPEEIRGSITHWSQWIDYWAVDWNFRDDTFHNEWQSYRTKQNPKIDLDITNTYAQKGNYTVIVKVIDILGNDTTKVLNIEIK
jgi:adenine specific DNA methylase Mod